MPNEIERFESARRGCGPRVKTAYWLVILACCALLAGISFLATQRFMPG